MSKKTPFMSTTEIDPMKTAGEITSCLVASGARKIMNEYDGGKIVGLTFSIDVDGLEQAFTLPVRVEPVYRLLQQQRHRGRIDRTQAERVAWRQLFRWIQAQCAMIETGMVETAEVFMPYMLQAGRKTLYEVYRERQLCLPAPEEPAMTP